MNGLMIQATSSNSGKSFIATGLCRLFKNMGINICPFKSQNMSNNSFVTQNGLEISTAQAIQAMAAKLIPQVFMNPIILKPRHQTSSEIILNGRVFAHTTKNYRDFAMSHGINAIKNSLSHISQNFEAVIIEGAGSPAEINLNAHEIVNMRISKLADVPVILVSDVDRGGSLASVAGTLELLGSDRKRVKGIIYNKFRGDINLFKDAVKWTENYTGIKVLGVLPFIDNINLSPEDSMNIISHENHNHNHINIGILKFPGISNFNDFDPFFNETDINLFYVDENISIKKFHDIDALILPGTKNTFAAMKWLIDSGLDIMIKNFKGFIFGICGGLQIMGREIIDNYHQENDTFTKINGLSIFPFTTRFNNQQKIARQINTSQISGYEIHYGTTNYDYDDKFMPLFMIDNKPEGMTDNQKISCTYIHGIFNNNNFRANWLNKIRKKIYGTHKINAYTANIDVFDEIAESIKKYIDVNYLVNLLFHHEDTMPQL